MITINQYSKKDIKKVLKEVGVNIYSETNTDFLCLCPFHDNRNTPSFAISYSKGLFVCYNPSCDAKGNLMDLLRLAGNMDEFQIIRVIALIKRDQDVISDEEFEDMLDDKPDFIEYNQSEIDLMHSNLMKDTNDGKTYLLSRGIYEESMEYFELGYSYKQEMVIVPIHSPAGMLVGLVGRSIEGKRFKNSTGLPRSQTMFNLHRARKTSSTLIVCEASFDAIRIHQAGFPNVVATLGGGLSKENIANLNKYCSSIIIATDSDDAGRKLGYEIASKLSNKDISWASYSEGIIYPDGAKDVGTLSDEEISQCIKNSTSHFEYLNW